MQVRMSPQKQSPCSSKRHKLVRIFVEKLCVHIIMVNLKHMTVGNVIKETMSTVVKIV